MTLSPLVRVCVPTYRRPTLLLRALESLRRQTFTNWIAEVHNDDPVDVKPAELVRKLGDPRIGLHCHPANLGAAGTFNLIYQPSPQPFFSILEDDNWWEPPFLETLLTQLDRHPEVVLAWCNQRIAEELPDGSWRLTDELVNPQEGAREPRLIEFGDSRQALGALHANGAMVMRTMPGARYATPAGWPFAAVEPWRERMIDHPILYTPEPLAVFGRTLETARDGRTDRWSIAQTMLVATFVKQGRHDDSELRALLVGAREARSPATAPFLVSALIEPGCRRLLRHTRPQDWWRLLRGFCRRPALLCRMLRCRRLYADWWDALDRNTAARFAQAGSRRTSARAAMADSSASSG